MVTAFKASSAWEMMVHTAANEQPQAISTCSSALDQLMGGGFSLGHVTEVAGAAGSGKTQMCFQACVNVQLPICAGGVNGEAVYLDSECTFIPSRITDMANSINQQFDLGHDIFDCSNILSKIFYHRVMSAQDLMKTLIDIEHMVKAKPQIKLIVVDSIAAPLRHEFDDYTYRSELIAHVGALMASLASKHGVAVVVTNQMTTRLNVKHDEARSSQVPSLGKTWASIPALQLVIGRSEMTSGIASCNHQRRRAEILKLLNPSLCSDQCCYFQITKDGIRDVQFPAGR